MKNPPFFKLFRFDPEASLEVFSSNKTEHKALTIIAQMITGFEKLHYLDMTKEDDLDATKARNLLESIIQTNGYKINCEKNSKKTLLKIE